jgi:hypothetical protein
MRGNFISSSLYALVGTVIILSSLSVSFAQVMQSSNYSIQSDSINFAGGLSTSTNYTLESTAGEVGTGYSSSTNFALGAGYQQLNEVYIALSGSNNVAMSPSIPGVSGGIANGSTTVTVTTDSPSGYSLSIEAEGTPAMQKGADTIADYVPVGDPDFTFTTGAADAHFGFSPEGEDIVQRFKDNESVCNGVGTEDTQFACWDGLSTTAQEIAATTNPNHPIGATTTVRFRVGVGGSVVQPPGTYTATTTITALPI